MGESSAGRGGSGALPFPTGIGYGCRAKLSGVWSLPGRRLFGGAFVWTQELKFPTKTATGRERHCVLEVIGDLHFLVLFFFSVWGPHPALLKAYVYLALRSELTPGGGSGDPFIGGPGVRTWVA